MEDLEKFTCDMLQCIRTGYEQEIFLRKGAGRGLKRDKLARIKLAIHFQHKKVRKSFFSEDYCTVDQSAEFRHITRLADKNIRLKFQLAEFV